MASSSSHSLSKPISWKISDEAKDICVLPNGNFAVLTQPPFKSSPQHLAIYSSEGSLILPPRELKWPAGKYAVFFPTINKREPDILERVESFPLSNIASINNYIVGTADYYKYFFDANTLDLIGIMGGANYHITTRAVKRPGSTASYITFNEYGWPGIDLDFSKPTAPTWMPRPDTEGFHNLTILSSNRIALWEYYGKTISVDGVHKIELDPLPGDSNAVGLIALPNDQLGVVRANFSTNGIFCDIYNMATQNHVMRTQFEGNRVDIVKLGSMYAGQLIYIQLINNKVHFFNLNTRIQSTHCFEDRIKIIEDKLVKIAQQPLSGESLIILEDVPLLKEAHSNIMKQYLTPRELIGIVNSYSFSSNFSFFNNEKQAEIREIAPEWKRNKLVK